MTVAQQATNPNSGTPTQETLHFEPHHAEYLKERAVDPARAVAAGLRSVTAEEGATLLGFDQPLSASGLFIPYANAPDYARIRLFEGDTRFLVPRDREVPIYIPPGCELEGSAPICVTEGPIKALALQHHGFDAVGLGGITTTLTKKDHKLNDSWSEVAVCRREIVLVFDAGRARNPDVARAEARLALELERVGARVKLAALPLRENGKDQGPDDFLATHSSAELRAVIAAAVPADPIERFKYIAMRVPTAEEREQAAMGLLDDFPFLASVKARGIGVEQQILALLRKYKVAARDFRRAMKQMEERAKEKAPAVVDSSGSPYVVHNGQLCFVSRFGDAATHQPICNFTASILHEEVLHDGVDSQRRFTLTGTLAGGALLPSIHLTAAEFSDEGWPMKKWGARAVVFALPRSASHLRAAIQQQSTPLCSTTYTHTGLREHDGRWIYLHADGAVGAPDVAVQLDDGFRRYKLPDVAEDLVESVRTSFATLRVADPRITAPLHAAVYRAPLQEVDYCDASLALYGGTGSLKSSAAALFLSHFGDFEHDTLPLSWTATTNAIEANLHKLKDALVVIDDFVPKSADPGDEFHKKAGQVFRATGNGNGRQRLTRELLLRPSRPPRALVITTGEQLPEGGSIRARLVTIRMRREDVDLAQLTRLQQQRSCLAHAMRGYIEWLLPRLDSIRAEEKGEHAKYRSSLEREGGVHLRAPSAMAHLLVGAHYFAEFAVSIGALDQPEADDYLRTVREALVANNREQSRLASEMKPTRRFLSVIKSLLLQGKVNLVSVHLPLATLDEKDIGINIGWEDDKFIYLAPEPAYTAFVQALRAMNENVPSDQSTLWAALADEKLATKGDGKNLLPKRRLGGARPRVVEIQRSLVRDPTDIEERIDEEVDGSATDPEDDDPDGGDPAGGAHVGGTGGGTEPEPETGKGSVPSAASFTPPTLLRLPHSALLARPWPDSGPIEESDHSPSDPDTYTSWPYWPYLPEGMDPAQRPPSQPDQGRESSAFTRGVPPTSETVGPSSSTTGSDTGITVQASRAWSGRESGHGTVPLAAFAQAALQEGRVGIAVRCPDRDRPTLLALRTPSGAACVVDLTESSTLGALASLLREVTVVGHDIKSPLVHLAQHWGVEPKAIIDTALLWKLRDLGEHLDDPKHFTFERARTEAGCSSNDNAHTVSVIQSDHQRALQEARDVLLIADRLGEELHTCGLDEVVELEMKLLPIVAEMERAGLPINRTAWASLVADWNAEAAAIEQRFAAVRVNIRSDREVRAALLKQGIVVTRTGGDALAPFAHVPFVQDLVRYRSVQGFVVSAGKEVLRVLNKNGRVHGSWNQLGAATGRMSCSRPNLLGLPRDPRVRGCIQAPPGKKLVIADYSTIELRILADYLGEEQLVALFQRGGDPHLETAMRLLDVDPTHITDEERKRAKSINFGLMNGMGAASLVSYALENYNVVMSLEQAEEYKRKYLEFYTGVASWHDYVKSEKLDALRSASGRLRYFSDSSNNYNAKLCTPIQGTSADGLKQAMVLLAPRLKPFGATIILAVHDELLVEAPEEHADAVKEIMRECMVAGMAMYVKTVPIVVEPEVKNSWEN